MAKEDGKIVEKFVYDALRGLMDEHAVYVHRFIDSHDAGRFVAPQPADLMFCSMLAGSVFVEVKSSTVLQSMRDDPKSLFSPQQIGKVKLLDRAAQIVLAVFYCADFDHFEIWLLNDQPDNITKSNTLCTSALVAVVEPEHLAKWFLEGYQITEASKPCVKWTPFL